MVCNASMATTNLVLGKYSSLSSIALCYFLHCFIKSSTETRNMLGLCSKHGGEDTESYSLWQSTHSFKQSRILVLINSTIIIQFCQEKNITCFLCCGFNFTPQNVLQSERENPTYTYSVLTAVEMPLFTPFNS